MSIWPRRSVQNAINSGELRAQQRGLTIRADCLPWLGMEDLSHAPKQQGVTYLIA